MVAQRTAEGSVREAGPAFTGAPRRRHEPVASRRLGPAGARRSFSVQSHNPIQLTPKLAAQPEQRWQFKGTATRHYDSKPGARGSLLAYAAASHAQSSTHRRYPTRSPRLAAHLSWQTRWMVSKPDDDFAEAIAKELAACRRRGVERLDVSTHNQNVVRTPILQRLANEYVMTTQFNAHGRAAQLKLLLRDAIKVFTLENEADAQLVRDLFFGESPNRVTKSPGDLLDLARRKTEYPTDSLFKHGRLTAFTEFAQFLPGFVRNAKEEKARSKAADNAVTGNAMLPELRVPTRAEEVSDPEPRHHDLSIGYARNGKHFTRLLAEAASVTIVGITNENLASMLRIALDQKRAALQRPDACWDSLRIVSLTDKLLDMVSDEHREYPDQAEALKWRRQAAMQGRRTVAAFLRRLPPDRSMTYESNYFPSVCGTLFEMPDGQRVVQLLVRRPTGASSDHLYLRMNDTPGRYFSALFEEIVHNSVDDNKVVPVGLPVVDRFRVTGIRYRHDALKDDSGATGWLPLVLVITWRTRGGRAEPLLQLRTELHATRELGRLSHLSAHIVEDDRGRLPEFGLEDAVPLRAARHRVQMETSEEDSGILRPLATSTYIHPDKENLFFFVYSCEFPQGFRPFSEAEMYPVSLSDLLSIRENQTLRLALQLCESPPVRGKARSYAFEIAELNLTLHGHSEVARRMVNARSQGSAGIARIAQEIRRLEERTRKTWSGLEQNEVELMGLSGLQYREFFSLLLPYYERVGVPEADDHLRIIREDETARRAVARLAEIYHDESVMESIQLEL